MQPSGAPTGAASPPGSPPERPVRRVQSGAARTGAEQLRGHPIWTKAPGAAPGKQCFVMEMSADRRADDPEVGGAASAPPAEPRDRLSHANQRMPPQPRPAQRPRARDSRSRPRGPAVLPPLAAVVCAGRVKGGRGTAGGGGGGGTVRPTGSSLARCSGPRAPLSRANLPARSWS